MEQDCCLCRRDHAGHLLTAQCHGCQEAVDVILAEFKPRALADVLRDATYQP